MAAYALRYAHAFQQVVATQHLNLNAVRQQLNDFAGTLQNSKALREVLENPALSHQDKLKVLDAIGVKIGFLPQVRNFLAVLMDHQRLSELNDVLAEFFAVADAAAGIYSAEITSARELSDADKQILAAQAARLAGGEVRVVWKQDASLLGGAIVQVGSTVYDGSVRGQLNQIERHLVGA